MGKHPRHTFFKVLIICFTAVIMLLSAGVPTNAAEGQTPDVTPSGTKISSLEAVIDTYAGVAALKQTTAAVSVAVVKNGETIFDKAYGFADVERQTAADMDTVFEWGSVTKLLVWTSVMQLVEQGKLDLGKDIREYLPEGFLTKLKFDEPITLLNLMNHNAGWQDRYTDLYYLQEEDVPGLAEALRIFEPRQVYKPDTVVAYSNYGAALAAYIVELQSGQPFYTYVNEHIFEVLGMDRTSIHPAQQDNPAVGAARSNIQGYTTELELIKQNRGYIGIYPAGSAIGTAEDAAKFMAALMPAAGSISPLFQSNATLREMLTPSLYYEGIEVPRVAHGFWVNEHAVRTLEHGGNTAAFSSKFVIDPASGFGMIVMTNQQNEWQYCTGLVDRIFGTYNPESYDGDLPDSSEVEGTYLPARRVIHGFSKMFVYLNPVEITAVNKRVYNWNGDPASQFAPNMYTPVHQSGFTYFVRNDQGTVVKLSTTYGDFFPLSGFSANSTGISLIALGFGAALTLLALIIGLIRFGVRKFRKVSSPLSGLDKYHLWINTAGLAIILNNVIMVYRSLNYVTYSSVRVHLLLNIVYVVLSAGYVVLLLLKLRRTESRRIRKVLYVLSGVSAILLSALIIGWDLYY